MSVRKKRSAVLLALVALGICGFIIFRETHHSEPPPPRRAWYYDLNTRRLFSGGLGLLPPIDAPSGPLADGRPAGVRAYVFGCKSCRESERFIAYLETYTEQARAQDWSMQQSSPPRPDASFQPGQGILVKRPDDASWVERNSPEGQQIIS